MNGFIIRTPDSRIWQPYEFNKPFTVLRAAGVALGSVCVEDIKDKSKSDEFLRALTRFQISWLFVQLIGRAVQSLPITTLELSTASNAACAVVSYAIWWSKPKDVERPVILQSAFSYAEIQDRTEHHDPIPAYPRRYVYMGWTLQTLAIFLASLPLFDGSSLSQHTQNT